MSTARPPLFTIGHSDHELPALLALLRRHAVDAVADVRSHPYARYHTQFNREPLAEALQQAGLRYVFLGRELGARRAEAEAYVGRQARYDRIVRLPAFVEGLARIRRGVATHRIALLCAERDPITCHRTILICRQLRADPLEICHIREDGQLESTEQVELRLLEVVGLPPSDLFRSREELVEEAYDRQAGQLAYVQTETPDAAGDAP